MGGARLYIDIKPLTVSTVLYCHKGTKFNWTFNLGDREEIEIKLAIVSSFNLIIDFDVYFSFFIADRNRKNADIMQG